MPGKFIVFEGLDRSGKSTQVDVLVKRLESEGRQVILRKFPDRTTTIGKMIDNYLQSKAELDDRAIHLLFSANRWEIAAKIEADLANGFDVIADRYAFSGIAFSAAKGLDFDYCLSPDRGLPMPDLTLFLTIPPDVASRRAAYGTERYETRDMQQRVREQFTKVKQRVLDMHGIWIDIDAVGEIEQVSDRIWAAVEKNVEQAKSGGKLWEK